MAFNKDAWLLTSKDACPPSVTAPSLSPTTDAAAPISLSPSVSNLPGNSAYCVNSGSTEVLDYGMKKVLLTSCSSDSTIQVNRLRVGNYPGTSSSFSINAKTLLSSSNSIDYISRNLPSSSCFNAGPIQIPASNLVIQIECWNSNGPCVLLQDYDASCIKPSSLLSGNSSCTGGIIAGAILGPLTAVILIFVTQIILKKFRKSKKISLNLLETQVQPQQMNSTSGPFQVVELNKP